MLFPKLACAAAFSVLVGSAARAAPPTLSIIDLLDKDPRFTETVNMLFITGYPNSVSGMDQFTVFVPTNAGWRAGHYGGLLVSMNSLNKHPPRGAEIMVLLRGFTVRGAVMPSDVAGKTMILQNMLGEPVAFDGTTVRWPAADGGFHEAKLAGPPIITLNGVMYPVDIVVWGHDGDSPTRKGVFNEQP